MIKLKVYNAGVNITEYFDDVRLNEVRQMLEKVGFIKVSEQIYVLASDKSKKAVICPVFVRNGDLDGLTFLLETVVSNG
jgi:hypothetical protein